jgi:hypothetical protein
MSIANATPTTSTSQSAPGPHHVSPPSNEGGSGADSGADVLGDAAAELAAIEKALAEQEKTAEPAPEAKAKEEPEPKELEPGEKPEEAAAKEVEKPKEEPAPTDKIGKARAALAVREKKLVDDKAAHRAQVAQTESHLNARIAEVNQLTERANAVIAEAKRDPLRWLETYAGMSQKDIATRILNNNKAGPEELHARATGEVAELRKTVEALNRRLEQQQQVEGRAAAERAFVDAARAKDKDTPKYPTLTRIYSEPGELIREAYRVAEDVKARSGRTPSDQDLLEYLEWRDARRYGGGTGAPTPAKATENGSAHQGTKGGSVSGPTLSNKATAERATLPKPIEMMSPDEERAFVLEQATKAHIA